MKQTIIAVAAALAAMVGWAGESAEFRLDTMDGTRTARTVETIAYSTAWNNGGAVSVAVDGAAIKEANAPASGDIVWNAAQATPGTHTLTHTCGGETQWYLSNDLAQCSPNVAWVTSATRVEESSYGLFDIFLLDYGWGKGWAGTGDSLTFLELARYTKARYDAVFSGIVFDHETYSKEVNIENDVVLSHVTAGKRGSHDTNGRVPGTPQGVVASQGQYYTKIWARWNPVDDATGYAVFFRIGVGEKWTGCVWGQPQDERNERWPIAEELDGGDPAMRFFKVEVETP